VLVADVTNTEKRDDPWGHTDRLVITSIEPWNLIVAAERLHHTRELSAVARRRDRLRCRMVNAAFADEDGPAAGNNAGNNLSATEDN
jgi:hypothetical protein